MLLYLIFFRIVENQLLVGFAALITEKTASLNFQASLVLCGKGTDGLSIN